ncbi:MAG TPA: hypothetical protein VFT56_14300 [Sphingomonas sp.]|nr:hypothetical protein [Sphingomonas sp.]
MMTRAEILYGTDEAQPRPLRCAAGPLTFELVAGNLRTIRVAGVEVLRGIQYLVRDRDWGTLAPTIADLRIAKSGSEGVRIAYRATCTGPDGARLDYEAAIVATPAGLDFVVDSIARDEFTANRIGFCILHPAGLAGSPLSVEHDDGSTERSAFPVLIEPWQPFTDIRALTHEQDGLVVTCRLDGDTFEMEDQRNWSDASYKTYVRPLARPWPYIIPAGSRDRQSVRLRISGVRPSPAVDNGDVEVRIGEPIGVMPGIGLVLTPEEAAATERQRTWLARSGVQDLLLTFDAAAGHGAAEMAALARAAGTVAARRTLECVLACKGEPDAELEKIAAYIEQAGLELDGIAVFPAPDLQSTPPGSEWPPCPPLEEVYAAARRAFPRLRLGGGMFGYFTEFNRKRVPAAALDFVTHATCPIVHAADDVSVMQTLETVPHIARSARAIVPDKPYRLGPVTIGMRQNPYGSRTIPNPDRRRMAMARNDPRQDGRFAAAWTLGYAAGTEDARLDTLTLGALTGPLGIVGENGSRPVFAAITTLAALAGAPRRACRTSAPDKLAAICAGGTLLLANLTSEPVRSRLPDGRTETLDAYATVRIALT